MEISFSKYTTLYKKLTREINNLKNIGKFLALWDCTTGLPKTNPSELPYIYETGDYYRVQNTSEDGTKYIPNGSQYTGEASTTIDEEDSQTGDIWFYDGELWSKQSKSDGGSGTSNYRDLSNKPLINNVTLIGNKSASDLGLVTSSDIVDNLESIASDKPISARAVNVDLVDYIDESITATMRYIDQQDASEHAGRVAGDNLLDTRITAIEGKYIYIPTIVISISQIISSDPLTVQFTSEQDAIITSDNKFINVDATAVGTGVTIFFKEKTNIEGDYMLISPTANYNASSLIPQSLTTLAIVYRHSTMIGVHKELRNSIDMYIKDASVSSDDNTLTLVKKDDTEVEFSPKGSGIPIVTTIPAGGMLPDVFYALGVITTDPNVALASALTDGKDHKWMLSFSIGATAPTSVTFPSSVKFPSTLSFEVNKHYEVSIKWDATDSVYYGLIQSWDRALANSEDTPPVLD